MRPTASLLTVTLAALISLAGGTAGAATIKYSISTTTNPRYVLAANGGTGGVALTNMVSTTYTAAVQTFTPTVLSAFTSASPKTPDKLINQSYTITVKIRDDASGATGQLNFKGTLNGTMSATGYQLSNSISAPATQKIHLGKFWYEVTVGPTSLFSSGGFASVKGTVKVTAG